jgi:prepilin-type processing-associated H-X9-DG protein
MAAFVDAYRRRVAQRLPFNEDLEAPPGRGSMGTDKFYRLREGVEKELLKGDPAPAALATLQSKIPVIWDRFESKRNSLFFNHVPGGSNVLFLDGHVEFRRFPSDWPTSRAALNYLDAIFAMHP